MNKQSNIEFEVLKDDLDKLRGQFAELTDLLRASARHAGDEAANQARRAGEHAWNKARGKAEDVISQIEEKPVTSAAIAFGIGLLLGIIFGRR